MERALLKINAFATLDIMITHAKLTIAQIFLTIMPMFAHLMAVVSNHKLARARMAMMAIIVKFQFVSVTKPPIGKCATIKMALALLLKHALAMWITLAANVKFQFATIFLQILRMFARNVMEVVSATTHAPAIAGTLA